MSFGKAPRGAPPSAAALTAVAALACFAMLTIVVLGFGVDGWDRASLRAMERLHGDALTSAMRAVTSLGSFPVLGPIAAAAVLAFALRRRLRHAVLVALAVTGAEILQLVAKPTFGRPRPTVFPPLAHETSPSYPSGHALVSAAFALALVIIARETRWRWRVGAAASAYVLAVGFSRLYLGVHYPSDVLAGWCLAVAWAATASILVRQRQRASSG